MAMHTLPLYTHYATLKHPVHTLACDCFIRHGSFLLSSDSQRIAFNASLCNFGMLIHKSKQIVLEANTKLRIPFRYMLLTNEGRQTKYIKGV
jgi:hypothetical protein